MPDILEGIDDLHDDDEIAFVELTIRYQEEFERAFAELDDRADATRVYLVYLHKVLAAARTLNIDPFAGWDNPDRGSALDFFNDFSLAFEQMKVALQIRHARTRKVYSVELDGATKQRIHFLIGKIRTVVEDADLEERKKNSLFKKLAAFAADVDKARTTFNNAMLMGLDIAHLAKKFGDAIKPATEFVNSITELLAEAKAQEPEQQQLPPAEERKKIEAPRKQIEGPKFSRDMDDDIPF